MGMLTDRWVLGVGALVAHEPDENSEVEGEGRRRKAEAFGAFGPAAFGGRSAMQPGRDATGALAGTKGMKQACGMCNCEGLGPIDGCHAAAATPTCEVAEEMPEMVCGAGGSVPRGFPPWGVATFNTRLLSLGDT